MEVAQSVVPRRVEGLSRQQEGTDVARPASESELKGTSCADYTKGPRIRSERFNSDVRVNCNGGRVLML